MIITAPGDEPPTACWPSAANNSWSTARLNHKKTPLTKWPGLALYGPILYRTYRTNEPGDSSDQGR